MFQLVVHGRGGQGAKTLALMLAQAAIESGRYAQAYPDFGPERTGAPVRAFLRIDSEEILTREPVTHPNAVVVLDDSLLDDPETQESLAHQPTLIINSSLTPKEIKKIIDQKIEQSLPAGFNSKIHTISAQAAISNCTNKIHPTTPIIGKLIRITEIVSLEDIKKTYEEKFLEKLGEAATEETLKVLEDGYCEL